MNSQRHHPEPDLARVALDNARKDARRTRAKAAGRIPTRPSRTISSGRAVSAAPVPLKVTVAEVIAEQGWAAPTTDDIAVQCQTIVAALLPALPVIGFIAHTATLVLQAPSPPYATLGRLATPKVIAQINAHFDRRTVRAVAIHLASQEEPTAPAPCSPAEDPFVRIIRARQEEQARREPAMPLTDDGSRWSFSRPPGTVRARALARARADSPKPTAPESP